jgi:altronate dehydratase small subunit
MPPAYDPPPTLPPAARLLLLAPEDNVLVACADLRAGDLVLIDGEPLVLAQTIGLGHKVARQALRAADKLLRYGACIGSATRDIARGEHVHTHNLASDYIPTYTLEPARRFVDHAPEVAP